MTTSRLLPTVVVAAFIGAMLGAFSSPAGAITPPDGRPVVTTPYRVAHVASRSANVAPLNNAEVSYSDSSSFVPLSSPGTVAVDAGDSSPTTGQLVITFGTGDSLFFSPYPQATRTGTVYSTANTVITVDLDGTYCGTDVNLGQDSAQLLFDQYSAPDPGSGVPKAFALQFNCDDPDFNISGTLAFNILPTTPHQGYYQYDQYGDTFGFGNDSYLTYLGNPGFLNLNAPIVGMATTPDGNGYWMTGADGGVFAYGDAGFYGSTGNINLVRPIVGMAATTDGKGYWFVAADGGVFAYGDAGFYGSMGAKHLNQPIVGMAPTADGKGYWLVAADGGIFSFGDAGFYGSAGNIHLNQPIVGMTATQDGKGYWFVASDGGVFSYGDAPFYGSAGNLQLNEPVTGMLATPGSRGYWLVASDGGLFAYGDAQFEGSLGGQGFTDIVGMVR
jgi:hypothetical protein